MDTELDLDDVSLSERSEANVGSERGDVRDGVVDGDGGGEGDTCSKRMRKSRERRLRQGMLRGVERKDGEKDPW